jgi:RHS repeat-associated protein
VQQGTQLRYFMYDSLSRLIRARNPELTNNSSLNLADPITGNSSWSMAYSYDSNSNLTIRTDARSIVTTFAYDEINRNKETAYSDGTPKIKRFYDEASISNGKGRLWKSEVLPDGTTASLRSVVNAFDEMGRVKSYTQGYYENSQWQDYTSLSSYDLAGNRISETYPSGRQVVTGYSGSGRMSTLGTNDIQLLSGMTYTPFGGLASETYGSGLIHAMQYNNRAQPTEIKLGSPDVSDSVLRLNYLYGTLSSVNDADAQMLTLQNNGNIGRVKYTIGGSLKYSQTFQYDQLNRLKFAVEHDDGVLTDGTRAWWETFDYDMWGNRGLNITGSKTSTNMNQSGSALGIGAFSQSTNRITNASYGYDLFGNLTFVPGRPNDLFDGENKLKESTVNSIVSAYVYDADGRRVKKTVGSAVTRFVYNAEGQLIAEYETLGTPPAFALQFATADHLGSPRAWTNGGAVAANGRHDYAPFGEELGTAHGAVRSTVPGYSTNSQADGQRRQFGSKERDTETGLDWFSPGRYFSSSQGRFTTVDPLMSSGTIYDPQTWNRYSYTINNPLKYTDPFGLFIWSDSLGGNATDEELRTRAGKDKNALKEANKIINKRQAFRDGLTEASRAANNQNLTVDQRAQISGALASYGAEGTDNGVSVGLGRLANGVAAEARTAYFPFDTNSNTFAARVEVVLSDRGSGNLAIDTAHEGRHVADAQAFAGALTADLANQGLSAIAGALNRTRYDREVRGYLVSSYTAQGLGLPNLSFGSREVWNSGWREAERAELRSRAISNHLRESPTYRLTPEAPGERYIPRQ